VHVQVQGGRVVGVSVGWRRPRPTTDNANGLTAAVALGGPNLPLPTLLAPQLALVGALLSSDTMLFHSCGWLWVCDCGLA